VSPSKLKSGSPTGGPPNDAWIETLHSNKMCSPATGKVLIADAETFFFQRAAERVGLPRTRPKNDFRRAFRSCKSRRAARKRHQPWRAGTDEHLLQSHVRSVAGIQCGTRNALQGFAEDFRKALMNGSGEETWNSNSGCRKVSSIDRSLKACCESGAPRTESESEFIARLSIHEPQFCDACKGNAEAEILAVTLGGGRPPQFPASRGNIIEAIRRKFLADAKNGEPEARAPQNSRSFNYGRLQFVRGKSG